MGAKLKLYAAANEKCLHCSSSAKHMFHLNRPALAAFFEVNNQQPNSFSIPKEPAFKKDFMSQIIKKGQQVPGPEKYNYNNGLGKNGKFFISN